MLAIERGQSASHPIADALHLSPLGKSERQATRPFSVAPPALA